MRITVAILIAALHCSWAYPHQSSQYISSGRTNSLSSGVAQGYIRYLDLDGSQRLVGYSYPEPLYTVHRLSYDAQKTGRSPLITTSVQPGYIEQEYTYKEGSDSSVMREEHFRVWNLQRYQSLKSEVDKLYAEGQTPSADMLARLQQLAAMSSINTETNYLKDTPEVQKAREEHLRIWNEANQKALNQQSVEKQAIVSNSQPIVPILQSEVVENAELIKNAHSDELRAWKDANSKTLETQVVEAAQQQKAHAEQEQIVRSGKWEHDAIPITYAVPEGSFAFPQAPADINAPVVDTPEVQQAKQEHLRLWHEAKQRSEASFKQNYAEVAANEPAVQAAAAQVQQIQSSIPQAAVKDASTLIASLESGQIQQSLNVAASSDDTQVKSQDLYIATVDRTREQHELAKEELREQERIREEQRQVELLKQRESKRIQEEELQMQTELKRLQAEDHAQLTQDLHTKQQGERVGKIYGDVVQQTGGVYFLNNRYQQKPLVVRVHTPSAQSNYYSIPAAKSVIPVNPFLQNKPVALAIPEVKALPLAYLPQKSESQAISELEKAKQEHFAAHEAALKRLDLANGVQSSSYYNIHGGKSAFSSQPAAVYYVPQQQGLTQLDRANQEHYRAYNAAVNQLDVANQRAYHNLDVANQRAHQNCN